MVICFLCKRRIPQRNALSLIEDMPLYEIASRPASDPCSLKYRQDANRRQCDYNTRNEQPACWDKTSSDAIHAFAAAHPNLRLRGSYGLGACVVDTDSLLKKDAGRVTKDRCKQQLTNRVFHAVPLLSKGAVLPGLESRIQAGQDTTAIQECDNLREKGWDTFHPGMCQQGLCQRDVLQPWAGESSRDISKSPEFLASLGYVQERGIWVRRS